MWLISCHCNILHRFLWNCHCVHMHNDRFQPCMKLHWGGLGQWSRLSEMNFHTHTHTCSLSHIVTQIQQQKSRYTNKLRCIQPKQSADFRTPVRKRLRSVTSCFMERSYFLWYKDVCFDMSVRTHTIQPCLLKIAHVLHNEAYKPPSLCPSLWPNRLSFFFTFPFAIFSDVF